VHLGNDSFSRIASSASIRSDVTHIICPSSHGNNVFAGPGQGSSPLPNPRRGRKRPSSPANIAFDNLSSVSDRPGPRLGHTHTHTHTHTLCIVSGRFVYLFIARAHTPRPIFITSRRPSGRCVISPFSRRRQNALPDRSVQTDNQCESVGPLDGGRIGQNNSFYIGTTWHEAAVTSEAARLTRLQWARCTVGHEIFIIFCTPKLSRV